MLRAGASEAFFATTKHFSPLRRNLCAPVRACFRVIWRATLRRGRVLSASGRDGSPPSNGPHLVAAIGGVGNNNVLLHAAQGITYSTQPPLCAGTLWKRYQTS